MGFWISYVLGMENENLLIFVVLFDYCGFVSNGLKNWGVVFFLVSV